MKALTFEGLQRIGYGTVDDPSILDPQDAIVRVKLTAICGSDMHIYHERERGLDRGCVMGHEFVGEIVEVGPGVRTFGAGDAVVSPFTTNCGSCFYCRCGLTARCERGQLYGWVEGGQGLQGAQAELVRVPLADSTLVSIPSDIPEEEALLLGDVLSTGYFCAELAGVRPEGVYAVIGCGPVGLMALVGAQELGAEKIYAIDRVPERLDQARSLGATPIDFTEEDPLEQLRDVTAGRGADAVLEVVGSPEAGRSAFRLVRPGGTVAVVGVHNEPHFAFTPNDAYDKNLTYRVGRCPARRIMERLIPLVRSRRYDLSSVISHRLGLDRGVEGYAMFDEKRDGCTKVVLKP